MSDASTTPAKAPASKRAATRLQHVVVLQQGVGEYADVVVFGQEIDALRHIIGKPDWRYVAVAHGVSVAEALKAAGS